MYCQFTLSTKIVVTFVYHSFTALCVQAVSRGEQGKKGLFTAPPTAGRLETGSTVAQSAAAHGVSQHAATSSSSSSSSSWQNRGSSENTLTLIRELCTPPLQCLSCWMAHIHSRLFPPPPRTLFSLSLPFSCVHNAPLPSLSPRPTACFPLPVQHAWVAAWRWRS